MFLIMDEDGDGDSDTNIYDIFHRVNRNFWNFKAFSLYLLLHVHGKSTHYSNALFSKL